MLEIINLEFEYQDKPLLKAINFHVPSGGLLHLCGPNGAGKTTLLKLLAGLFRPSSGKIIWEGQAICEDYTWYQEQLCLIGHKSALHPALSVFENLYFDVKTRISSTELDVLLKKAGLQAIRNRACGQISAGQQRRAALLRLQLSGAKIWLLDEPLVALDDYTVGQFKDILQNHRQAGGVIILTSHQPLPDLPDHREYWI